MVSPFAAFALGPSSAVWIETMRLAPCVRIGVPGVGRRGRSGSGTKRGQRRAQGQWKGAPQNFESLTEPGGRNLPERGLDQAPT